jgi:ABC-2 type transport system ATP-binding protein
VRQTAAGVAVYCTGSLEGIRLGCEPLVRRDYDLLFVPSAERWPREMPAWSHPHRGEIVTRVLRLARDRGWRFRRRGVLIAGVTAVRAVGYDGARSMTPAIETRALRKVYPAPKPRRGRGVGAGLAGPPRMPPGPPGSMMAPTSATPTAGGIVALDGLDLTIGEGEFFGLLGPNGAGKTTTIGILTTRVLPTGGTAAIGGADVVAEAVAVRRRIGVVPQRPNPDRGLDVIENLIFHAAYFGFPRAASRARALGILERLGLADRAASRVDELSGGQLQRLMIARALVHEPRVIFLDEPTVGLDPQARLALWEILRGLHAEGTTIVMTTHYMEEAEKLCARVAIVDRGQLLACDAPDALKKQAPGGTLVELTLDGDAAPAREAARAVPGVLDAAVAGATLRVYHPQGGEAVARLIGVVQGAGRQVTNIRLVPPNLETLFLSLTGRRLD